MSSEIMARIPSGSRPARRQSSGAGASGPERALSPSGSIEELIDGNLAWLRGWLGAQLSGRHRQEIDDLCQEVVLRAIKHHGSLRDREKFPAWLYRIARNVVKDYQRSLGRASSLEPRLAEELPDPRSTDARLEQEDEVRFVTRKLMALPRRYREPLLLRHVDDLSYAEIGRILGIPENTVQVRIFRGRKLLRRACREERAEDEARSDS